MALARGFDRRSRAPSFWFIGLMALGGCRAPERDAAAAAATSPRPWFIALEHDFHSFRDWTKVNLPERDPQGLTHGGGKARAFINAIPTGHSTTYPIGTIIVKDIEATDTERHRLFAMAKRGAGFNSHGAKNWEWFELEERADDTVGIVWRGITAPSGEGYGGDALGTCNNCHLRAAGNDYVQSLALALR